MTTLCFIVDQSIAWVGWPLSRRGFLTYRPHYDYPMDADDAEIVKWAKKTGCIIITRDWYLMILASREGAKALWVPPEWDNRYNSWEIVTKIVKYTARINKSRKRSAPQL